MREVYCLNLYEWLGAIMPSASDFKKGMRIEYEGDPFVIVSISTQTPSARGAATLVKTKLRNLRTKQLLTKSFKTNEKFRDPDFEIRNVQYLYEENGELFHFMDEENYEQYEIPKDDIENEMGFIKPDDSVKALFFEGRVIGLEVTNTVELLVVECEPAVKGDTVNAVTKTAKLETGLKVQVPMFVNQGDKLIIDTKESRYIKRA
jgi:elongation factor P